MSGRFGSVRPKDDVLRHWRSVLGELLHGIDGVLNRHLTIARCLRPRSEVVIDQVAISVSHAVMTVAERVHPDQGGPRAVRAETQGRAVLACEFGCPVAATRRQAENRLDDRRYMPAAAQHILSFSIPCGVVVPAAHHAVTVSERVTAHRQVTIATRGMTVRSAARQRKMAT
jgi:hypothetical protein